MLVFIEFLKSWINDLWFNPLLLRFVNHKNFNILWFFVIIAS